MPYCLLPALLLRRKAMEVRIAREILVGLQALAAATPTVEICGLLFGNDDRIARAEPTINVAASPENSFEIDPAALFAALRAARTGGDMLIGHYHSHPNGRTDPSPRDLAAAEPGKLWLILGGGVARLWLAGPGGFREIPLIAD